MTGPAVTDLAPLPAEGDPHARLGLPLWIDQGEMR